MSRYLDLATMLAEQIAAGELPAGAALPSVRTLASREGTTPATALRAYGELARAGAIVSEPRRTAHVAYHGAIAARALLRGGSPFRLAGSDDPALDLLLSGAAEAIVPVGARGSYRGLSALWSGAADGAALHLRHPSGDYNAPFARGLLAGRRPVLVHLWRREQGLILAPGNPRQVDDVAALDGLRVARRPVGTGTRTLLDRLLLDAGVTPESVVGPQVELHLDVALAVATGEADTGLGLRSAAAALGLDFVPVASEPFEVATTEREAGGVQPLLSLLADPTVRARIEDLGGHDLAGAGEVLELS